MLLAASAAFGQTRSQSAYPASGPGQNPSEVPGATSLESGGRTDDGTRGWLEPGTDPENRLLSPFIKHLAQDQKEFWTEPAHFKVSDLKWIVPFAGVTTAFIASDSWWGRQVPSSHVQTSLHVSDYGTYSLIGLDGAAFVLGEMTGNDHLQESGLLGGEAAINSTAVAYLFKEITQRPRPNSGTGNGDFFQGGASFPSEHAAIAWSVASVWAHEYPGWLSQMGAYSLATAISATRVTSKEHFPSDVIVGSALGWYFGREVYRAHHDPEVGGGGWGNLIETKSGDQPRNPSRMASPYVPLDSWIYPALERLIALGYVQSGMLGMRPWTRMECAHLLDDAESKFSDSGAEQGEAGKLYSALLDEFHPEVDRLDGAANVGAGVESVYTRTMGIFGTPLRDGYHFGQTIINDYGRPYWEGGNNVTGITADAEAGPVSFYVRAEYQHAPAMPSKSPQTLAATAAADATPPLADGMAETDRVRLLDSMASYNFDNVQISVGNQSAWLGPGESGSLLMSNNAAPFPMVRVDQTVPHDIPLISRVLGPVRTEFFIGQLSGQHWEYCAVPGCQSYPGYPGVVGPNIVPQPFIHGDKISFQPTPNLEIGMGITAMFGGPGLPVTFGNYFRTYTTHSAKAANNPGKRISAADLTYRVAKLRQWLTFYLDSLVVDEVSPIGSQRATVNPGIYLPQIPKIHKLQLRAEGINESTTTEFSPGFIYYDLRRFRSGYTNDGNLLGSWIGRAGRGAQSWLTYSFTPRDNVQLGYRLQEVSKAFIGGGRLVDYSASGNFMVRPQIAISGLLQYEQWAFPMLEPGQHSDVTASLGITFYPRWRTNK